MPAAPSRETVQMAFKHPYHLTMGDTFKGSVVIYNVQADFNFTAHKTMTIYGARRTKLYSDGSAHLFQLTDHNLNHP